MIFLFFSLVCLTTSLNYTFSDSIVELTTISQGSLVRYTSGDTCNNIQVRSQQVYHLNTGGVYQSWPKGDFSSSTLVLNSSGLLQSTNGFGVDSTGRSVVFSISGLASKIKVTLLQTDYTFSSQTSFGGLLSAAPDFVFVEGSYIYTYYISGYVAGKSSMELVNKSNGNSLGRADLSTRYQKTTITPDFSQAVAWTTYSSLVFYSLPDLVLLGSYEPAVTPASGATGKITFSSDSSLALLETDSANELLILSMSNYSVVNSVSVLDTIIEAHFLDSTNTLVIIFCPSATIYVDLSNGNKQYSTSPIVAVDYASDQNSSIFICESNQLSQLEVKFTRVSATINSTNTSNNSNETSNWQENAQSNVESQFYTTYNFSQTQKSFYEIVNTSLAISTQATNIISTFASSMPLTVYFLSFINYFTLSSLYVLLNFPIPQSVYKYLALVYDKINANFLALLGLDLSVPSLSDERVDRRRPLFFGVSSDLLSSSLVAFLFLVGNVALVCVLHCLALKLRKGSYFRKLISKERWPMIYGQVTNVLAQLTLPWTFLMLNAGVRNFGTKVNAAAYAVLFFVGVFFPIYYFFELLQQREQQLLAERKLNKLKTVKDRKRNISQPIRQVLGKQRKPCLKSQSCSPKFRSKATINTLKVAYKLDLKRQGQSGVQQSRYSNFRKNRKKFQDANNAKRQMMKAIYSNIAQPLKKKEKMVPSSAETIRFKELLTPQVMEKWYMCQGNFLLPVVVLVPNPTFFLVTIFLFSTLGGAIAFKRTRYRLNSFILSFYPLIFHLCFMIFYWCSEEQILIVTEIVCLGSYLLGCIHHTLTLIYEIGYFVFATVREIRKYNKISPITPLSTIKRPVQENKEIDIFEPRELSKQSTHRQSSRLLTKIKKVPRHPVSAMQVRFRQ